MQAVQTQALDLMRFTQVGGGENAVEAAWPVYRDSGAASTAVVYIVLEPGMRLPRHTDSAEEVLVVLEGEIEATIGEERGRLSAGGVAVVPSMVPHGLVNAGPATARIAGVFSANTVVSTFERDFDQTGGRVVGTPPPAEALAAA
ncbi:MAG TPA: cupin domain-containing protein [Capillimicrobium sp.]|jgi:quercetin dioxygenase-like cupin family protein|nr:cupin domain-containing protein [Capillimicrobium sp.]